MPSPSPETRASGTSAVPWCYTQDATTISPLMADATGPLATQSREPGQARKGAAEAVAAGAGVWLVAAASPFRADQRYAARPAWRSTDGMG